MQILGCMFIMSSLYLIVFLTEDENGEVNIKINILKDDYNIDIQSDLMPKANFNIKKGNKKKFLKLFKYTLYPYFGGVEPAPNSMDILIEKI